MLSVQVCKKHRKKHETLRTQGGLGINPQEIKRSNANSELCKRWCSNSLLVIQKILRKNDSFFFKHPFRTGGSKRKKRHPSMDIEGPNPFACSFQKVETVSTGLKLNQRSFMVLLATPMLAPAASLSQSLQRPKKYPKTLQHATLHSLGSLPDKSSVEAEAAKPQLPTVIF